MSTWDMQRGIIWELLTPSLWFSKPQKLLVNLQGYFI